MHPFKILLSVGLLVMTPLIAFAGEQTVTLKVDGMTCASCPYQVKSALKRVEGVTKADASLEKGEAIVVFDDEKTDVAALALAVTNAGYPTVVKGKVTDKKEAAALMETAKKAAAKRGSH